MMKDQSIAEIKNALQAGLVSEIELIELRSDHRKGVQQAVKTYLNKLEKQHALQAQFLEMTQYEIKHRTKGKKSIAGIDEVGRGPLAGPVVAAAVILPDDFSLIGLTDSKKLSVKQRNTFDKQIREAAISIGIGIVDNMGIDQYNIYQASVIAMEEAVKNLEQEPDQLLIDAVNLPRLPYESEVIIKGDQKSISIAAASVIAKVYRDQLMQEYHELYPDYQFNNNQGYGTKAHLKGIEDHGITPIHRKSFEPIKSYVK